MIDAAFVVAGSIIGAGIFFVGASVADSVQSKSAFLGLWVLGGLVALAGALSNGELGAMYPRGGGEYVYMRAAYGAPAGFLSGWTAFCIGMPGSIATLAYGFARNVAALVGAASHIFELVVALAAVVALTAVNALGLGPGKWTQNVLSGTKLVAFAALLVLGLVASPNARAEAVPFVRGVAQEQSARLAVGIVPIMFAYFGWNAATYLAGEIRDPQRNLGRALLLGTAVSVVLYIAVNLVYLRALPLDEMRTTKAVAAASFERLAGRSANSVLTPLVAIAILSSLQATVIGGPRIYRSMAEDGVFFVGLRKLHERTRVPVAGLVVQAAIACVLLLSGTFEQLLTFTTFAMTLFATATVAAVFVLRVRRPHAERAFRVAGYPVTPAFFIAANAWLMWSVLAFSAREALVGLGIVALGVPVYACFRSRPGA
jgi:APA family basic amino acid/polyamine antiporter